MLAKDPSESVVEEVPLLDEARREKVSLLLTSGQ